MGSVLSNMLGGNAAESPAASAENSPVKQFHSVDKWKRHFNELKDTNKLMVIDFYASWCGPCRFMEPALRAMAADYPYEDFVKINVDELSEVAEEWKVKAMPTFVLVKQGKEVDRVVGANKDELEKKIQQHRVLPA